MGKGKLNNSYLMIHLKCLAEGCEEEGSSFTISEPLHLEELRLLKGSQPVTEWEADMIPPLPFFLSNPTPLLPEVSLNGSIYFLTHSFVQHVLNTYNVPGTVTEAGESSRVWPLKDFSRQGNK